MNKHMELENMCMCAGVQTQYLAQTLAQTLALPINMLGVKTDSPERELKEKG